MSLFGNKYLRTIVMSCDGLPLPPENATYLTALDDEHKLEIKIPFLKDTPIINLDYSKITAIEKLNKAEIIEYEQKRSVVGRAVAGGLLLGGIGAVIGGMSGLEKKKKKKKIYNEYIIINYISSIGDEQAMSFIIPPACMNSSKFVSHLQERCNIKFNNDTTSTRKSIDL